MPIFGFRWPRRIRTVITPLPSYVTAACCDDIDHVLNRKVANVSGSIHENLGGLKRSLRDYLFVSGKRDVIVVDPNISVRNLAATEIWGDDPVHPRAEVYSAIAADLLSLQETVPGKRKAASENDGGQQARRPQVSEREKVLVRTVHGSLARGGQRGALGGGQSGLGLGSRGTGSGAGFIDRSGRHSWSDDRRGERGGRGDGQDRRGGGHPPYEYRGRGNYGNRARSERRRGGATYGRGRHGY